MPLIGQFECLHRPCLGDGRGQGSRGKAGRKRGFSASALSLSGLLPWTRNCLPGMWPPSGTRSRQVGLGVSPQFDGPSSSSFLVLDVLTQFPRGAPRVWRRDWTGRGRLVTSRVRGGLGALGTTTSSISAPILKIDITVSEFSGKPYFFHFGLEI